MKEASSELRSSAVATLCKASHSYTHTTGDDASCLLLYALHQHHNYYIIHITHCHYVIITSSLHYHYITIALSLNLHTPLRYHYILISSLFVAVVPGGRHLATALYTDILWGGHSQGPQDKGKEATELPS